MMGRNTHLIFFAILLIGVEFCRGERPEVEVKETKGEKANQFILDCVVTYKGEQVTSGVTWTDGEGKQLSPNNHLTVTLKPGANVMRCKYEVDGWSGHRTLTRVLQTISSSTSGERPTAEIKETKGDTENQYKLDCIVNYMGQQVTSGVTWVDADDKQLSSNSHLDITLKPGANVVRCKYMVGGWSGHKTLTMIVQTGGSSTETDEQPVAEIKESKGKGRFGLILDCIVVHKGQKATSGVSWTDGEGKELSPNSHLEITLKPGPNVMRCKYEVNGWSGHKTLNRILQIDDQSTTNQKPEVEIDEQRGNAENEYILDCIVKHGGKRVTSGVSWTDSNDKVLSENHLLKVTLKVGENVVRCKYQVGGWSGTKTLTMVVQKESTTTEKPEVIINEKQGASGTHFTLDCVVMYKGERVTSGVIWTDGKGTVLSHNSHLEVTLKAGANVMRCKYEVGGWSGHKTVVRILQIGGSTDGSDSSTSGSSSSGSSGGSDNGGRKTFVIMKTGDPETSYKEWQELCQHKGGRLARIYSEAEQKLVEAVLVKMNSKSVLIDGQRMGGRGDTPMGWVFDDGSMLTYTNWNKGEPNNANRNENCIQVYGVGPNLGKWNDVPCKFDAALCLVTKKTGRPGPAGPETKPAKPETKPAKPETKPTEPETKPSKPETKPAVPEKKPTVPETKPAEPTITYRYILIEGDKKISHEKMEELCREKGGRLASIDSAAAQKAVEAAAKKAKSSSVLIGIHRKNKEGKIFVNPNGAAVTYTNWAPKEPNHLSERCVEIYKSNGKWNDIDCKGSAGLCELDVSQRPLVEISEKADSTGRKLKLDCQVSYGGDPVESGISWTDGSGKELSRNSHLEVTLKTGTNVMRCNFKFSIWQGSKTLIKTIREETTDSGSKVSYGILPAPTTPTKKYVLINIGKKISAASWEEKCKAQGGRLASINNEVEQKLLMSVLKDLKTNSILTGIKRNPKNLKEFINSDGQPISYTNWAPKEPNHESEKCVEVYKSNGKWNDIDCKGETALCEIRQASAHVVFAPQPLPKSFVLISGSELPYESWQIKCRTQGGQLAKIQNAADQKMAEAVVSRVRTLSVLISGKRTKGGDFTFPDGAKVTYSNWNKGEPNNSGKNEGCIELYSSNGKWNDVSCNKRGAALCEVPDSGMPAPIAAKTLILIDNSKALKLEEWSKKCVEHGGKLASINNAGDQRAAEALLKKQKTEAHAALIAIHRDPKKPESFLTGEGKPLAFSNWAKGEPNFVTEKCAEIYTNGKFGKWNDIGCQGKAALCEIAKFQPLPVSVKHFGILESKEKLHVSAWKAKCEAQGGRLATMGSADEAHTAEAALKMAKKRAVLIGVFRSLKDSSKFVTLDGQVVSYTNWARGEPNNRKERCVEVFSGEGKRGKWNDFECTGDAAMCEFGQSTIIFAMAPRTKSFWIVEGKSRSFEDWQKECGTKGGQLAKLENAADLEDAKPVLKKANLYSLMVDGKRSKGNFLYSNGNPVTYKHWNKGEPNNDGGKENCMEIFGKGDKIGLFNDIPCKHIIALCQK